MQPQGRMTMPDVDYARSGDVSIAYQVMGEGPVDLVYIPFMGNLRWAWEQPRVVRLYQRLASFSRLIVLDKRGIGLSDRPRTLTLEAQMDDLRAVLDAVGSERAALLGVQAGGQMCALFAATYPERTSALIAFHTAAGGSATRDIGLDEIRSDWGTRLYAERLLAVIAPSVAHDEDFVDWFVWMQRLSAGPRDAYVFWRMLAETDLRDALPAIRVPTLVLYRAPWREPALEFSRLVRGSRTVELPGADSMPFIGDEVALEVERFLSGVTEEPIPDTVLTTTLFTDIVGSSARAADLGDRAWRELLERHHAVVRRELARFRGQEIDTAGDGFFATFDGPARAIRCAERIVAALRELGLDVRAGIHTGECEVIGAKVTGFAVNVGARVAAVAQPCEILVSRTVRDLVAGSGISFSDRGVHELKGIPGEWALYAVAG